MLSMSTGRVIAVVVIIAAALLTAPSAQAFCFGTIHVHVFNDANGNGVLDSGETARPGVAVQLDQLADGTVEQTLMTDANGDVDFFAPAVVPYRVRIVAPAGTAQSMDNPPDMNLTCNGVTPVSFGLVAAPAPPAVPTLSGVMLAMLALSIAGIAVVRR